MLPPELDAHQSPITETRPEVTLCIGLRVAKGTREIPRRSPRLHSSNCPLTLPSPPSGARV
jgi:hypothetical protein